MGFEEKGRKEGKIGGEKGRSVHSDYVQPKTHRRRE
jgi:hypothetical protein